MAAACTPSPKSRAPSPSAPPPPSAPSAASLPAASGSTLRAPEPGARWARGSSQVVAWAPAASAGDVTIELRAPGGAIVASERAPAARGRAVVVAPPTGDRLEVRITSRGALDASVDVALAPSEHRAYRWVRVTERAAFPRRDGAGSVVFRNKMWVVGGWYPSAAFPRLTGNDVWSSPDGARWTRERANSFRDATFDATRDWEGRHTGGCVVFGDKIWLLGGDPLQYHYQPDVWSSEDGRRWRRVAARVPWGNRALHYAVVHDGRMWVIGGQTMPDYVDPDDSGVPYRVFDDVWSSSDGAEWREAPRLGPRFSPRGAIVGSAVLGGRIWVLGGGTYESAVAGKPSREYNGDAWSSADGSRWTLESAHVPWEAREYHAVAVWDDRLWVVGGYNDGGNLGDAWYSTDGKSWYSTGPTEWDPRHAACLWVHRDALWLGCGGDEDVWRLERSTVIEKSVGK